MKALISYNLEGDETKLDSKFTEPGYYSNSFDFLIPSVFLHKIYLVAKIVHGGSREGVTKWDSQHFFSVVFEKTSSA